MQGLIDFERLVPPEAQEKWALKLPRARGNPEADDGVIRRCRDEHDWKLFAHVRRGFLKHLHDAGVTVPGELLPWIAACHELRESCREQAFLFLQALDGVMPGYAFAERMRAAEESPNTCVIRPVKYEDCEFGYTGRHTDRNGLTLNLGATAPGFYVERQDGSQATFAYEPYYAPAFPGRQLEEITGGTIRATPHGSKRVAGINRCALVCFFYLAA